MILNNKFEFENNSILEDLQRLTNQIYKLLPSREENLDWEAPLYTIIEEFLGMGYLMPKDYQGLLFSLICKLQGLLLLAEENDFQLYRRTIFDCLNIISKIKEKIKEEA